MSRRLPPRLVRRSARPWDATPLDGSGRDELSGSTSELAGSRCRRHRVRRLTERGGHHPVRMRLSGAFPGCRATGRSSSNACRSGSGRSDLGVDSQDARDLPQSSTWQSTSGARRHRPPGSRATRPRADGNRWNLQGRRSTIGRRSIDDSSGVWTGRGRLRTRHRMVFATKPSRTGSGKRFDPPTSTSRHPGYGPRRRIPGLDQAGNDPGHGGTGRGDRDPLCPSSSPSRPQQVASHTGLRIGAGPSRPGLDRDRVGPTSSSRTGPDHRDEGIGLLRSNRGSNHRRHAGDSHALRIP